MTQFGTPDDTRPRNRLDCRVIDIKTTGTTSSCRPSEAAPPAQRRQRNLKPCGSRRATATLLGTSTLSYGRTDRIGQTGSLYGSADRVTGRAIPGAIPAPGITQRSQAQDVGAADQPGTDLADVDDATVELV